MDELPALFSGTGEQRAEPALPPPLDAQLRTRGSYIPSDALRDAVNVALLLGQPLLLTGEPGTGKTTLARALAHERFGGRILELAVKSESGRADMLYRIDEMGRFRDAQPGRAPRRLLEYFELQPLGEAIVRACGPDAALCDRAGRPLRGDEPFLADVFGPDWPKHQVPTAANLLPGVPDFSAAQRWVVLVDEIDKASRDTPNDLLEEFERMAFAIPELRLSVRPPEGAPRPVVIVTSNSEKSLPDAFLRRCAFHHITFPTETDLRLILASRLGRLAMGDARLGEMLALFEQFRRDMQRKPGTAELLQWLHLADATPAFREGSRRERAATMVGLISAVAKQETDVVRAQTAIAVWADQSG